MGTDYYSYLMVGVQANKYISHHTEYRDIVKYNENTGKPYFVNKRVEYYIYRGREFKSLNEIRAEINPKDLYWKDTITLQTYAEGLNDQDTIGLVVLENAEGDIRNNSLTIKELQEKIDECKELLRLLSIEEEPTIRLVMYVSY